MLQLLQQWNQMEFPWRPALADSGTWRDENGQGIWNLYLIGGDQTKGNTLSRMEHHGGQHHTSINKSIIMFATFRVCAWAGSASAKVDTCCIAIFKPIRVEVPLRRNLETSTLFQWHRSNGGIIAILTAQRSGRMWARIWFDQFPLSAFCAVGKSVSVDGGFHKNSCTPFFTEKQCMYYAMYGIRCSRM